MTDTKPTVSDEVRSSFDLADLSALDLLELVNVLKAESELHRSRVRTLEEALREIIERWDTPLWKDVEPTGAVINRARQALGGHNA